MPEAPAPHSPPAADVPARPRFSWPMRIFLFAILFDMVFHSLAALAPYKDWRRDLEMSLYPERLPTCEEMGELAEKAGPDNPHPVGDRVLESADSVWNYFKPWPSAATRKKITGWEDGGKFALCWLTTRLGFIESTLRIEQRWTMFSPNVGTGDTLVRSRLAYKDGTGRFERVSADPEDLTHFGHWFKEKVLEYETRLVKDDEARRGYCNLLAHRFPASATGSPLVKIYLIKVRVRYPDPDEEDVAGFLRRQSAKDGPPGWKKKAPFYEYDVPTRTGKELP
jgi:hypothetical protein